MTTNAAKCGIMVICPDGVGPGYDSLVQFLTANPKLRQLQGHPVGVVEQYTYLGCVVHRGLQLDPMVADRAEKGSRAALAVLPFLRNRAIPLHIRVTVFTKTVLMTRTKPDRDTMGAAAQPWGHRPPDPLPHSGVRVKLCLLLEVLVRLIAAPFAGTTPIKRSMTACPHGILTVADFSVRSVVGCAPAFCAVFMRHASACFSMCLASMAWMRLLLALDRARPARLDAQCHMTPCFRQQLNQLFEAPRPTPGPARGPGSEEPTCTVVQHGRCVLLSAGIHSAGEQAPTTAQAKEGRLAGITSLGPSA